MQNTKLRACFLENKAINPEDPAAWIGKALMGEINVEAAQIISVGSSFHSSSTATTT